MPKTNRNAGKAGSAVQLRRRLNHGLRLLRRRYKACLRGNAPSGHNAPTGHSAPTGQSRPVGAWATYNEWLRDNFYLVERESRTALNELAERRASKKTWLGMENVTRFLRAQFGSGFVPAEQPFFEALARLKPTAEQVEWLPLLIRLTLAETAILSMYAEQEAAVTQLGGAVKAFRTLPDWDFASALEAMNPLEQILNRDPAGVYPRMDEQTRALYRSLIRRKAHKAHWTVEEYAENLLRMATEAPKDSRRRHIGTPLLDGARHLPRGKALLILESVLPLVMALCAGIWLRSWLVGILLPLPLWAVMRTVLELCFLRGVPSLPPPRLELGGDIPPEGRTLIVVSTLLPRADKAAGLRRRMEELYNSNCLPAEGKERNASVCILADFKGADTAVLPQDDADIAAAVRETDALNAKYGGGFLLFVRPRQYSPTMDNYTGWERKRGAVAQLTRFLRGKEPMVSFIAAAGDLKNLSAYRYILALDADTELPLDTLPEFISAALHPYNMPHFDAEQKRVTAGYGILVPYVGTDAQSAVSTPFAHVMAGEGGLTPYANTAAERYQDLFGRTLFCGKGLIDVEAFLAFEEAVEMPQESVLSHDILEGGYLRAGFLGDTQLMDGFPSKQQSYFTRLERWVRGDFQNIPFIGKSAGLDGLTRYALFDNLRRAALAPACLLALFACLYQDAVTIAVLGGAVCLALCLPYWVSAVRALLSGGGGMFFRTFFADGLPSALGDFVRSVLQIVTLAQSAWTQGSAAVRGVWRRFVSGRNKLAWTTAAQGEKSAARLKDFLSHWPSLLAGAALLAFGRAPLRLVGLAFLCDIVFDYCTQKPKKQPPVSLSEAGQDRLTGYCAAMWKYFDTYCTERNHYLPPDNVQETPVFRVADRTSPTNLGLYLLSIVTARDLGFLTTPGMVSRLSRALDAIEQLETWKGNLLNWYDTRTLQALHPRYVSAVDSGNFLVCLTALRQALRERLGEDEAVKRIIARAEALEYKADLRPLYNSRRKLFHIGMDLENGELSKSYYDMLMSEARMTGYYAIARRMIPKKHWKTLGRTLGKHGRFTGPMSWTGTMFEYFMPYLFLPAPKGSIGYEALRFCVYCQQQRARDIAKKRGTAIPWGMSESGFYAFDGSMNYQYKAHGVQTLGLRRGLDDDAVTAPYASFLAMQLHPRAAMRNLGHFERLEMTGDCGFYEACDLTPARTAGRENAVVRSYMAHHVGMSLLAGANVLRGGMWRERFMKDPAMRRAETLLLERIPDGSHVFDDVDLPETPAPRERISHARETIPEPNPANPKAHMLSNGEWTLCTADSGAMSAFYRSVSVFRREPDILRRPQGVASVVHLDGEAEPFSVAFAPFTRRDAERSAEFNPREAIHRAIHGPLRITAAARVHARLPGESHTVRMKNSSKKPISGSLLLYFEPSMEDVAKPVEHPAFSRLFMESKYDARLYTISFCRTSREVGGESIWLSCGMTRGLRPLMESDRALVQKSGWRIPDGGQHRGNPDCCAAFALPFSLNAGESMECTLFIAAGSTQSESKSRLLQMRGERLSKTVPAPTPFREGELMAALAKTILPKLLWYAPQPREVLRRRKDCTSVKQALWATGVSGDYPYIYVYVPNEAAAASVAEYALLFRRLRRRGIPVELVAGFREQGDYHAPIRTAIESVIRADGGGQFLGIKGGIHEVNLARLNKNAADALEAYAAYTAGMEDAPAQHLRLLPLLTANSLLPDLPQTGFFTKDGAFAVPKGLSRPMRPWSLTLANAAFGTLVSADSLGFTWAVNCRENKLTPWDNDPVTDNKGELLLLRFGDKVYDMVRGSAAVFTPTAAFWYGEIHGLRWQIRVDVPKKGLTKRIAVRLSNLTDRNITPELCCYTEPVLGVRPAPDNIFVGEVLPDGVLLTSPTSRIKGTLSLQIRGTADFVCTDRAAFLSGIREGHTAYPNSDPCAAVGRRTLVPAHGDCYAEFSLGWGASRHAALTAFEYADFLDMPRDILQIGLPEIAPLDPENSPSNLRRLMENVWLPHQVVSCRLFARTGFYQCGGAWGLRDQLQDVFGIMKLRPDLARYQIFRAAAAQFPEGDGMHWWHSLPGEGARGVRTRYSDDFLWLPYVVAAYVRDIGDKSILSVRIPFRDGIPLAQNETERYAVYPLGAEKDTLLGHCIRACDRALNRLSPRGLPLIGGGDWNDGFDEVGVMGRGESVWLAMFLSMVLEQMADVIIDTEYNGKAYRAEAAKLRAAVEKYCWAGDRYLRAFRDDGSPIGGAGTGPCEIDILPQAFAVFCGMPSRTRRNTALDTALRELYDSRHRIVKLLKPPFTRTDRRAGYINSYPPGIRENGGQYTHAAVWLAMALRMEGRTAEAAALEDTLNPALLTLDEEALQRYGGEPYALAGDVSAAEDMEGRCGWSLYTGSAAWLLRAFMYAQAQAKTQEERPA
ncbi:MAG: hypothetical protein LBR73_02305 [Oscillospiraceae bacterium]|jgi:cyclic beta-1,2-glucan synthetase|nr:hypothetical protein [Oscillospiraceae bacterium]